MFGVMVYPRPVSVMVVYWGQSSRSQEEKMFGFLAWK